jgi:hypothetical protein
MLQENLRNTIQIGIAILFLSCLVVFAAYSATPWLLPSGTGVTATSLRVIVINPQATVGGSYHITISAVSDNGRFDSTRNDLIQIYANSESHAKLSQSRVNLVNGRVEFTLVDDYEEPVIVTVGWISGPTTLRGDSILIRVLGRST